MFVDKVKYSMSVKNNKLNMDDAIVFYFNESFGEPPNFTNKNLLSLPSLLPFDNMVIQFSNKNLFWVVTYLSDLPVKNDNNMFIDICWIGTIIKDEQGPQISKIASFGYLCNSKKMEITDCILGGKVSLNEEGQLVNITDDPCFLVLHKFLSLLSCKNVVYGLEFPPIKIQKSRAKKGKPPLSSYYILKLKPTTSRKDYEAKNLWTNRVHLCRGHIREYTEDRPLFGKYTGRFWIPPHVRGDKKQGVIHKDYEVETT